VTQYVTKSPHWQASINKKFIEWGWPKIFAGFAPIVMFPRGLATSFDAIAEFLS
jgi:hypothetical protein